MQRRALALIAVVLALVLGTAFCFGPASGGQQGGDPSGHAAGPPAGPDGTPFVAAGTAPPTPEPPAAHGDGQRAEIAAGTGLGEVLVQVVTQRDGASLPGLQVRLQQPGDPDPWADRPTATTDRTGGATFAVPPGTWEVTTSLGGGSACEVRAGATTRVRIAVLDGYSLAGTVQDRTGAPVPGAAIWLSCRDMRTGSIIATSDAAGAFTVRHVSGPRYVAAAHPHYATAPLQYVFAETGTECRMRIVLQARPAALRGVVLEPDGTPVAGARVLVGNEPDGGGNPPPVLVRTDGAGRFAAQGLQGGRAPVLVRARGFALWRGVAATTTGATADLRVVLAAAPVLQGMATDGSRPLPGVTVWSGQRRFAFDSIAALTDGEGRYQLIGLPVGASQVTAAGAGRPPQQTEVTLAAGELREWNPVLVEPPRGAAFLAGELRDHRGQPLAGWQVTARDEGTDRFHQTAVTDAAGRFEIDDARAGASLQLIARRPGASWQRWPEAIRRGVHVDDGKVEWQLPDPAASLGTLRMRVLDPLGRPAAVRVNLWHEQLHHYGVDRTDAEGCLELQLQPGTVTIDVQSPDHPLIRLQRQEVPAGGVLDLGDLALAQGCSVFGRITTATGEVPDAAEVQLLFSNGITSATCQGGSYRTGVLAAGRYQLLARAPGFAPLRATLTLAEGDQRELDLHLQTGARRELHVTLPADADAGGWITVRLFDSDGDVVALHGMPLGSGGVQVQLWLRDGDYRVLATAARNWRGEGTLRVAGAGEAPPLPIVLRRQ